MSVYRELIKLTEFRQTFFLTQILYLNQLHAIAWAYLHCQIVHHIKEYLPTQTFFLNIANALPTVGHKIKLFYVSLLFYPKPAVSLCSRQAQQQFSLRVVFNCQNLVKILFRHPFSKTSKQGALNFVRTYFSI